MGTSISTQLDENEISKFQDELRLKPNQIHRLYKRFQKLDRDGDGFITKDDLLQIPQLHMNPLRNKVLDIFDKHNKGEEGDKENINFDCFIRTLAVFRIPTPQDQIDEEKYKDPRKDMNATMKLRIRPSHFGTQALSAKKLELLFRVYDTDNNGSIGAPELREILLQMTGNTLEEDQVQGIVEQTMSDVDNDVDGSINFAEFKDALNNININEVMSINF